MKKISLRIEIVSSPIPALSSMGAASRAGLQLELLKTYSDVRITLIKNIADLKALVKRKPDLVFLGMSFITLRPLITQPEGPKIWLSHYLDRHGITYTGSPFQAHMLERNKELAKQHVLQAGLATAPFIVFEQNSVHCANDITFDYPVFIKPTNRGGGVGIDTASVAHNYQQLQVKVAQIANDFQENSLIEGYLPGREFSVAILQNLEDDSYYTLPLELIAPPNENGDRVLSESVKTADSELAVIVKDEALKMSICKLAIDVFHALGARDYGRIDIRLDTHGIPQFLEANLLPSLLNNYGNFPKACLLNIDMSYAQLTKQIVTLALRRQPVSNDFLLTSVASSPYVS